MKTYNPVYFNQGPDSGYIPANPTLETKINPAMRDNIMQPHETPQRWHAARPRWQFNHGTGILESPFMLPGIEARELNQILDLVRKNNGTTSVKEIRLYINSTCIDDCYTQLVHYGYERAGHLETKIPQLVFVTKSPRRWKD